MSNADLIADVRHDYSVDRDPAVLALADALEAAEAKLAQMGATLTELSSHRHQAHVAGEDDNECECVAMTVRDALGAAPGWPAELLEAVAHLYVWARPKDRDHVRATLVKYGLLGEEP